MEAILKKAKITPTILKQSFRSTEKQIAEDDILGWCNWKDINWIVFHNKSHGTISMFPMFKDLEKKMSMADNGKYALAVVFPKNIMTVHYIFNSEEERHLFYRNLESVLSIAKEKGQFYI